MHARRYAIKSALKTSLVVIKLILILHLLPDEDLIVTTLALNVTVYLRGMLQRALTLSALRAAKTKWTRLTVFLSYRVASDEELVSQLCACVLALVACFHAA